MSDSLASSSSSAPSTSSGSSTSGASTPPSTVPTSPTRAKSLLPDSPASSSSSSFPPEGYELPASLRPKDEYAAVACPPLPDAFPALPAVKVLDRPLDEGTPDAWIPRDPSLIRLTGKHPCNVEAPLTPLFDAGFLTPSELFYVRSHGSTPVVNGQLLADWRVEVSGLVKNPLSLSLSDLKSKFEVVTLPITLVCAGNRRREQNVVRKSLGFNWGAAGLSTALFTGVYLSDILAYAQPTKSAAGEKPKHVVFEGADELPKGKYGTSQTINRATDRNKGMLIAWLMNGLPLEPDHGFPIRLVVPGQIGGRSVKWLNKIEVSAQESQHYLHFWDNKVLPMELEPDVAKSQEHWWYDPKYIINDLNVNSAIAKPAHDEVLSLAAAGETYTLKGYAYAGGGRRVARVEVSLDGQNWTLANVTYPEDLYRSIAYSDSIYGTLDLTDRDECFCWCFWTFEVSVEALKNAGAGAVMVRGMDESLALQPRDMYLNPTSMMNNWWFRVAIHHSAADGTLRFEHPTLAGVQPGGWMQRMKDEGKDILNPVFKEVDGAAPVAKVEKKAEVKMTKDGISRKITLEELRAHNTHDEPWFVVNGEVYDGTGFLTDHPGGGESITLMAGEDATEDFMAIHSPQGKKMLVDYHIGTLIQPASDTAAAVSDAPAAIDATFLQKTKWKKTTLMSIENVSHDSRVFRFALEREDQPLGLPVGHHVFVRARGADGELVQRAYTPVSRQTEVGFIDLLIKLYLPNDKFPLGGRMSGCFNNLKVGDTIELKGPLGSFEWKGKSVANWRGVHKRFRNVGMVCGGSGVTPILQVLRGIFDDAEDVETRVWLLNGNRMVADILCREDLDTYLGPHSERYKLHHTLTVPPEDWPSHYSKGRMDLDMMRTHLPPPGEDSVVLLCGPDTLLDLTVKPGLEALGWDLATQVVCF